MKCGAGLALLSSVVSLACGNATEQAAEGLMDPGPRDAPFDAALFFDGVNDYASVGTARFPQIERHQTLALWVWPEASAEGADDAELQVLFTLRRGDYSGIVLALDDGVPRAFNVWGPRDLARAEAPLSFGRWQHLAYVLDREGSHLYVDGALVATGAAPGTNRTPISGFIASRDGYRNLFHGALDELRCYDRALSEEEIGALAQREALEEAEPLVLYLPFDELDGARSYDRSGLGNHAELGDGVVEAMPRRVRTDTLQSNAN
jgi:hypothetical protein